MQVGPVVAPTLFVQLTRAGRALARNLFGTTTRSKKDELSVGAWRILAFAYQQSPKKVWTYDVWHKSNLFPPLPLVTAGLAKKLLRLGLVAGTWDSLAITDAGKLFYKTQFDHYSRLYPRIKAVKPEEETV